HSMVCARRSSSPWGFILVQMRILAKPMRRPGEEIAEEGTLFLNGLQFLAGLEADRFAGRDANFFTGTRIASDAGLARLDVENPEAPQFNPLATSQSRFQSVEHSLYGVFSLCARHAGIGDHRVHYIQLYHQFPRCQKRKPMLDSPPWVVK